MAQTRTKHIPNTSFTTFAKLIGRQLSLGLFNDVSSTKRSQSVGLEGNLAMKYDLDLAESTIPVICLERLRKSTEDKQRPAGDSNLGLSCDNMLLVSSLHSKC